MSDTGSWLGPCALQSHKRCDPEDCEVRQHFDTFGAITDGQIKVGIATALAGVIVSSLFAVAVLVVWAYHAMHGQVMPAIHPLIVSIASAPFAAGVVTALKIPRRAKVLIEKENTHGD